MQMPSLMRTAQCVLLICSTSRTQQSFTDHMPFSIRWGTDSKQPRERRRDIDQPDGPYRFSRRDSRTGYEPYRLHGHALRIKPMLSLANRQWKSLNDARLSERIPRNIAIREIEISICRRLPAHSDARYVLWPEYARHDMVAGFGIDRAQHC